nr:MAG TPA: hypothetical protein [Caudoviricetes sp.]DAH76161.1 MAG TPA: hypothetical protein [Caudoviricetes sp.]
MLDKLRRLISKASYYILEAVHVNSPQQGLISSKRLISLRAYNIQDSSHRP